MGQRNRIVGAGLALHVADPNSTTSIPYDLLSPPRVITECRAKSNSRASLNESQKLKLK